MDNPNRSNGTSFLRVPEAVPSEARGHHLPRLPAILSDDAGSGEEHDAIEEQGHDHRE